MTNIEKLNKALANADESKIKEVLDFLGYKENEKFIPKKGDQCWQIYSNGLIYAFEWCDDEFDDYFLLMNNVYGTEEEAKQAYDLQTRKAKLIKEIEDSSDLIDWSNENQEKYFFYLNGYNNGLHLSSRFGALIQGATYTTNKQFLEELIKERSDEVKELLFGVRL